MAQSQKLIIENILRFIYVCTSVMDRLEVSTELLDTGKALNFLTCKIFGAVSLFVGVTREDTAGDGSKVVALEFEADEPLLIGEMGVIVAKVREQFPELGNVFIQHRFGHVLIGEASIIVGASSPHRKCAIHAVEALMESIKASLPIWKKERYNNASHVWKHNSENKW